MIDSMKDFPGVCKDRILLFDGGMGSLLQAEGLQAGMLPEVWNITHADVLKRIHGDYLDAGCDIVTTNTFGANPFKYPLEQTTDEHPYTLSQVLHAALQNARAAVREKGHGYVALDMGPTGKLMEPMGDMSFEDCVRAYAEVVKRGAADADLVLIETMSDLYELKAAVLAAKENCDLPVVATVAFDASGKLLTGGTPRSVVALLEGLRVDALGLNCGLGPADMAPMAKELLSYATVPVVVQPNAGLPRSEGGKTVYDLDAERFALEMRGILAAGASLAGGCCGTTPAHIAALRRETDAFLRAGKKTDAEKGRRRSTTLVTGFADAVVIGDDPVIIGERINPTGKKRFQQALKEADMEFILNVGLTQQEAGAHILDVNVGMPGVDEAAMMVRVVKELQSVTELPLQLDSSDPEALARAMRIYNGKPLINSVNGKQAVMDAVFPLVAKYGGVTVILCLDEDGIPETAEGRIRIAKRVIDEAASYGIDQKDLLIDALCMTISAEEQGALTTLETVRRARRELGTGCVLGVSNISFGLPRRDIVSAAFFTMAMENGLNAAIINPNSDEMMRAYRAFRALSAYDSHSADYIAAYGPGYLPPLPAEYRENVTPTAAKAVSDAPREEDASGSRSPLYRAILKGLKEQAQEAAEQAVTEGDTLSLINDEMMPALDAVGQGFEKGTVFLPQLIMSAEAAKAAFEIIRTHLTESGVQGESKGKVVIATVRGDIHDIGKNIVKVLLENYNFDVIDLGKDVKPETIVETAIREQVPLVGLSALMTTTVPAMEETIRLLHEQAPGIKVVVGGAVMTQEYADRIGADFYAKDAMGSVACAEQVLRA